MKNQIIHGGSFSSLVRNPRYALHYNRRLHQSCDFNIGFHTMMKQNCYSMHGGCFYSKISGIRCANRGLYTMFYCDDEVGFRTKSKG